MLDQIFRKSVPIELLFNLLEKICLKTEKCYVIDMNAYRKMIFHGYDVDFSRELAEYYHRSKQFYATRKMTYNSFVNMVRHICKNCDVYYKSQMFYNESEYTIHYFVHHNGEQHETSVHDK